MTDKLRAAAQAAYRAMISAELSDGSRREWEAAVDGLKDALAEQTVKESLTVAEQEPVACIKTNGELMWLKKPSTIYSKPRPLYTAPPRREWVGLTGDEIEDLPKDQTWWEIIRAAEEILKDKNT